MKKILEFINNLNLNLTDGQMNALSAYVDLVWDKKNSMNLTSVSSKEEIWGRHIADGLQFAKAVKDLGFEEGSFADIGSGAGYIGLAAAIALPKTNAALIESLEKRTIFLNWCVLKLDIKNVTILNERAGQAEPEQYDVVTERAMGKFDDILPVCMEYVKDGGFFLPFQSEAGNAGRFKTINYTLPLEDKERHIFVINKNGHN
ncbi:Methyltransferase GidB [Elusimicrobium minutum Pei191]|uniref:Ribosomal RNA small subunit methyltransferase G n=1 Tax=Elusimicrobium minutum (strain Pei191) TaxID=445932 RepID=B2KE62_ELUMP|nr:16S rRNA (guanine(527)-N(7))-methyltransferase RsmG [Elusimicrobium minutum]ACC98808.1 Methyltransferase GidB [Elusimicrobium minutum Pei191]